LAHILKRESTFPQILFCPSFFTLLVPFQPDFLGPLQQGKFHMVSINIIILSL
jgi:hypothetical protein